MAMNEKIKNIWKDPVWSKVIAAAIIAVAGALYSLVKSWLNENVSLEEAFKIVFSFQVNLWLAIAVVIMVLIIVGVIKKIKTNKQRVPVPPFVNDFTRGMYQNQVWKWRWVWSPTHKFYYVTDLNIECPNCHDGVLDLEHMNYRCPKCNASYEFAWINGNPEGVKKQILQDVRTQYGYCKEFIGEIKKQN